MSKSKTFELKEKIMCYLDGLCKNSNVILENDNRDYIIDIVSKLKQDTEEIIKWYSNINTKQGLLDLLRDFNIVEYRFNKIIELVKDRYEYCICLETENFKLIYKG